MPFTLRLAAVLAAASLALPALAHDRDDDCKDGRTLRLVNGRIHTLDKKDRVVSSVVIRNGRYMPPQRPGYSIEMTAETLERYQYPNGPVWIDLAQS